jgi:RNA polymerase sigma-70 factor (ECF subfamily)
VVLGGEDFENMLAELADPDSRLSRRWDQEHDQHVLRELLARVEPEFSARDWMAFRAVTLDGREAAAMAQELGVSVNVVLIAKSRILKRLRQEAKGILD